MPQTGGDEKAETLVEVEFAYRNNENGDVDDDEELQSQWAAIERLPTFERITTVLFCKRDEEKKRRERRRVMDVSKLEDLDRQLFIDELIRHVEIDNLRLLQKIRKRIDE